MAIGVEVESLGLPLETNTPLIDAEFPLYNEVDMTLCEDLRPRWQRKLPACYNIQPPPPPIEKIHAFSDETLFYIFYFRNSDPKLQDQAAYTLTLRGWRYWRQEKAWIIRDKHPIAPDVYVKFDANLWVPLRHRIPELGDSMLDPLPRDPKFPSGSALGSMAEIEVYPPEFDEIWRHVSPPQSIRGALEGDEDGLVDQMTT